MDNITEAIVIEEAPRRGRRPAARSGAAPAPAVEQQAAGLVADLRRDSITMPRQELAQSLRVAEAAGMIDQQLRSPNLCSVVKVVTL